MKQSILIVDDELAICESIQMILEFEEYASDYATSGEAGVEKIQHKAFDVVLLDIQMGAMNGFEALKIISDISPATKVIIISAFGNIENAVKATKLGAFDFLEKPIDRDKLLIAVRNAAAQAALLKENYEMKKILRDESEMIGGSPAMQKIYSLIERVAPTDARVLITGENGTGKELVARAIHRQSLRAHLPFVDVNCAAIPNELIESELFGHEKGSFTGAQQLRIGKFELADKGTLFLDEVGDMSLSAQAKVLRAIEDGKIERVGATKKINVDVRLIAATNKDIAAEIEKGNFREDLYHRLNVIPFFVPPLRERVEDIPALIQHFSRDIAGKYNKAAPDYSKEAVQFLQRLPWQGNIRELRNIVERLIIIVNRSFIELRDVEMIIPQGNKAIDDMIIESNSFQEFKEKAEKSYILKQLESNNWNISKTAEMLDIQRSHLYNKMKKYGIIKESENG